MAQNEESNLAQNNGKTDRMTMLANIQKIVEGQFAIVQDFIIILCLPSYYKIHVMSLCFEGPSWYLLFPALVFITKSCHVHLGDPS